MMSGGASPLALLRRAAWPAIGALIIINFVGYAIMGANGVLSWGDYHRLKNERAVELARLEAQRARINRHVNLLNPRHTDPDLAEELVRRDLGLVRPDEVVIPITDGPQSSISARPAAMSTQPAASIRR